MSHDRDFPQMGFVMVSIILMLFFPFNAISQDFPTKPITIYCSYEAGGSVDAGSRMFAEEAQKELGGPVVVENHPGGSGAVAASLLASKKPDGYTLSDVPTAQLAIVPLTVKVAFDPLKDFTFIFSATITPGNICVREDSPFKTLSDLIEYARKNPGTLSYGSPGKGGPQQLAVEYLARQANVKFKHVPFKGGAPSATALLGKHIDFNAGGGTNHKYVKQGAFRALAVTMAEERDPQFPNVPTLKELGYKDFPSNKQGLLFAPKGLPESISNKLEAVFLKVADSSKFRKLVESFGLIVILKNRRQLESEFQRDFQFYSSFLREIDLEKKN